MEHFQIIHALCRSAMANPTSALIHQVERLKGALEKDGNKKEASVLEGLLSATGRASEMAPSRLVRSRVMFQGEDLTPKTSLPVDKESATPLVEVIFPDSLPTAAPVFEIGVKSAIDSILNEWKHFEALQDIHVSPSRSCLIYGDPGTGKTRLAFWVAKQIGLPLVLAKLDGLMSSFLGTTSRNIGNLFSFANRYRCVLLLDEFDAVAKLRNDPQEVGEIKRVVNTLLQNLDSRQELGFTIGVTNHEKLLDPAIWRRFEIQIEIPKPSPDVMANLISKYLSPLELYDAEVKFLSWSLENRTGADAEVMVKWLKRWTLLNAETNISVVNQIRIFSVTNSGRLDPIKKKLLAKSDDDIAAALASDKVYDFKQKDIASLLRINPSSVSRFLSKNKS